MSVLFTEPMSYATLRAAVCVITITPLVVLCGTAHRSDAPQGPGRMRRTGAANAYFTTAQTCALCHSVAPRAKAMRDEDGRDVSPHGTWRATMMANSFRDPFWRAQVAREITEHEAQAAEIQALCVRCHAPMMHHSARLDGVKSTAVAAAGEDPLARDGVSCTVCHQARPEPFGKPSSFSGQLDIRSGRVVFGPYENPFAHPMRMHSGFEPTHGPHVRDAALCGSCHTLITHHTPNAAPFVEQASYLEWRNSVYSTEPERQAESRTCQECHMEDKGTLRIARNPGGRDFPPVRPRPNYREHAFVGGNAFVLGLLDRHRRLLGVEAPSAAFERGIDAARAQLRTAADVRVEDAVRRKGGVSFAVDVTNHSGHKLPTGYPARRAWLHVEVRRGGRVIWSSGAPDADGRIAGVDGESDPHPQPHHSAITEPRQVQVYECVAIDAHGAPTTSLVSMAKLTKDNRLLPAGWREDGPHAAETAPAGAAGDSDFAGGGDRVRYEAELDGAPAGDLIVAARLLYQPVPPRWVDALREVFADEAMRFVAIYDAADKTPEIIAEHIVQLH